MFIEERAENIIHTLDWTPCFVLDNTTLKSPCGLFKSS